MSIVSDKIVETECCICFCEEICVPCSKCDVNYCTECIDQYIESCHGENILPNCVNCSEILTDDMISDHNLYFECFYQHLMEEGKDDYEKYLSMQRMIKNIRLAKIKKFNEKFPAAITLLGNICYKKDLKNMTTNTSKLNKSIKETNKRFNKACFECDGFLDLNFKCLECMKQFCRHCEKPQLSGHECNKDDVESVKAMNDLIRCPKCKVPVFRSSGCQQMTCANCSTRFLYIKGDTRINIGLGGHSTILDEEKEIAMGKISNTFQNNHILKAEKILYSDEEALFEEDRLSLMKLEESKVKVGAKYYKLMMRNNYKNKLDKLYYQAYKNIKEGKSISDEFYEFIDASF